VDSEESLSRAEDVDRPFLDEVEMIGTGEEVPFGLRREGEAEDAVCEVVEGASDDLEVSVDLLDAGEECSTLWSRRRELAVLILALLVSAAFGVGVAKGSLSFCDLQ
jgi:hypothetical protein